MIYYIIFFICVGITVLKLLLSIIGGDLDFDIDADSVMDFDLGSLFSFKGILHFLTGASTWLALVQRFTGVVLLQDWLAAAVVGIIFMVVLFFLYRLLITGFSTKMELKTKEQLVGLEGTVNWANNERAEVVVSNNGESQFDDK